jgi:cytoskeletal protein CcmA (bactofilin family)
MNDKTEKKTLVEEGTEFIGTMRATCPIVVRGKIEGDVDAPAVSVTGSGSVSGNVKAKRVDSQGVLAGSVEADEVSLAGEVRSDTVIRARSLEVKLAAKQGRLEVTFGDCILDVGDAVAERAVADDTAKASVPAEPPATLSAAHEPASSRDNGSRASKKRAQPEAGTDEAPVERTEPIATAEADAAAPA